MGVVHDSVLAVLAQTRILVSTATFLFILYLRSLHVVYFTVGAVWTAIVAKVLKRIIRQHRPVATKKSYGMPSSHSQVIAFFTIYLHCILTAQARTLLNTALFLIIHIFGLSVVWSRVRLGHHTKSQVAVGILIGALIGYLWYIGWKDFVVQYESDLSHTYHDGDLLHVIVRLVNNAASQQTNK
ncbi:hypothetical protein VTP01DRAFT_4905 [Rhizomucor pusillus]|uniref:uncharacterized protein n=1 Tax=Rhizomucor pusillus TaxID=4840 RepID=UPI003742FD9B